MSSIKRLKQQDESLCFDSEMIKIAFGMNRMPYYGNPEVFIVINPSQGSNKRNPLSSNYTMIACIYPLHIVKITTVKANLGSCDINNEIREFMTKIIKKFPLSKIIIGVESSIGIEHARIEHMIKDSFQSHNFHFMSHFMNKSGLKINQANKETMIKLTKEAFKKRVVGVSVAYWDTNLDLKQLETELSCFNCNTTTAKSNLAVAFMLCVLIMNEYN